LNEDRLPKLPVTAESPNFQFAASPCNESTLYADFDSFVNLSISQHSPPFPENGGRLRAEKTDLRTHR
jgi:hypothetical protein